MKKMLSTTKTLSQGLGLLFFLFAQVVFAQTSFTEFTGKVVDKNSGKPLEAVSLRLVNRNIGTVTNTEGDYVLKVPQDYMNAQLSVNHLGYKPYVIDLEDLKRTDAIIELNQVVTKLSQVNISAYKSAKALIEKVFKNRMKNFDDQYLKMTAFYRETIKRRNRNVSLTEAVVDIVKQPYDMLGRDKIGLSKARKSTDYKRLDTLSVKLQGGPFSTIYLDVMKYTEYIFDENYSNYRFTFDEPSTIDNRDVYVVKFEPINNTMNLMYGGKLFIDVESLALVSAEYALDLRNKRRTKNLLVRKKPSDVIVYPVEANYKVDYSFDGEKWHYGYSNLYLKFKVNKKRSLFNKVYSLASEMAVTDWYKMKSRKDFDVKEPLRPSIIIADEISGFSDPDFWGQYNLIEPEKSIESAIEKIQKSIEKEKAKENNKEETLP
jgi:hypothetical protein